MIRQSYTNMDSSMHFGAGDNTFVLNMLISKAQSWLGFEEYETIIKINSYVM
jgi:hypothetical protein